MGCLRFDSTFILLSSSAVISAPYSLTKAMHISSATIYVRPEVCKNGRGYMLPLSACLLQFLQARKRRSGNSDFVFPGRAGRGHLRSCQKAVNQITQQSGIKFVMPDLRRSFVRAGLEERISAEMIRRLINEANPASSLAGMGNASKELPREAMELISARLLRVLGCSEKRAAG